MCMAAIIFFIAASFPDRNSAWPSWGLTASDVAALIRAAPMSVQRIRSSLMIVLLFGLRIGHGEPGVAESRALTRTRPGGMSGDIAGTWSGCTGKFSAIQEARPP